jgi:hypothetical protein
MLFGLFILALTSCDDMNSVNREYLDRGETPYIAKIDSAKFVAGLNKVWFKWWLSGDPRIVKTEIRWIEGITPKSREYILDRAQNDSLIIETVMEDVPEGTYSFEFINWDSEGNRSVSVIVSAEILGDKYKSSLFNRSITTATKFGNGYTLVWGTSDCLYSELEYRTPDGNSVYVLLPADSADVTPRMYLYDFDGSALVQKTYYLFETSKFVDTIVVPDEIYTGFNDVSVTLVSSAAAIAGPGYFDLGGEGVGFHDSNTGHDPGSGGANYRKNLGDYLSDAMDIESDGGNIGYTNPGEWVQYTVDVKDEDWYEIDWYISVNNNNGVACRIIVDDVAEFGYSLVNNASWNDWRYYCERNGIVPPIHYFTRGKHTVRFQWETGGFNFNGLRFKKIDPDRIIYRCPKAGWTVEVSDAHTDGGGKDKIIDDNYSSSNNYWQSQYSPDQPLPHWAVIDMKTPIKVAKIVTVRRNNGETKTLRYLTGDSFNTNPNASSWTKIAEGAYEPGTSNHSLTLDVAEPVAGRYLMLYLNDSFKTPYTSICEIDVYGIVE